MAILEVQNVEKIYSSRLGTQQVRALNKVSFSVEAGEYVAIMGELGSGKTTLLNILAGRGYREMAQRMQPIVRKLGIVELINKYPYEVSGGQKQRAAVARALITKPKLLLADEPTGSLDSRSADGLLKIFGEVNEEGQTILMVTHSARAASHAGRVLFIKDGDLFHQIYRGGGGNEEMYAKISDTLTLLAGKGERDA